MMAFADDTHIVTRSMRYKSRQKIFVAATFKSRIGGATRSFRAQVERNLKVAVTGLV
jgi:hypothetical protein